MARTGLAQDCVFEDHRGGPDHPERPERLQRIRQVLQERELDAACTPIPTTPAPSEAILRNHSKAYVERLEKACATGSAYIDVPDSAICRESEQVARLAAGTAIRATDAVMNGEVDHAFCAVRPPGHHAEHALSMGFCLYNNVAVAARHLTHTHGLERVLILDWDVHHGNGTQHSFEDDPRVLFVSLHGHPGIVYPGTGYEEERGRGKGEGFTLNVPMLPPGRDEDYRRAFDDIVLPRIETFKPQFVLVSAGFDAHRLDPLAPLELETESFGWMTEAMMKVSAQHAGGRLVSLLEGGYHLDALADSVACHLETLLRV